MVLDTLRGWMATGWVAIQTVPLSILAGVLCMGILILAVGTYLRRRRMGWPRPAENRDTFTARLAQYGFEPELCRLTYTYITEEQNITFPIEPFDRLKEDLGFDEVETTEMMHALLFAAERQLRPGVAARPVRTVADLLRFLQASPCKTLLVA